MHLAITLVCLVTAVVVVAGFCRRFDLPSPLVLIVVGIAGSYLPFIPDVQLSSEVVLVGLLPPLLYAAAIQTSLVDFNANRRSILLLSIGLVAFTTLGIGLLVHAMIPGISWGPSFAIGAVVAPPDAVAATTIGRRIGLPRRIVTILEGESLLNDATALVALRTAIVASVSWQRVSVDFVIAAVGGLAVGLVFFVVVAAVRKRVTDSVLDSGISFLTPFAAYVAAEQIHFGNHARPSGVLAVVVAGLLLGHKAPILQTAQSRIAERLNWRSIAFLLESSVFLLIGLQASHIIRDATGTDLTVTRVISICVLTLVGVIVLRMVWVFVARYLLIHPGPDGVTRLLPPPAYTALLGWAGMRGVVTLAAAFVIPATTPHRDVLLLIAFTVTAGTLFLQGLTLPLLARWLKVPAPDPMADALARANVLHQASQAGLATLDAMEEDDPHDVATMLRDRMERRDFSAWERVGASESETPSEIYARRRRAMIASERTRVLEIRDSGNVAHEVVEEVLSMLDIEESMLEYSDGERKRMRTSVANMALEGDCEDLRKARPNVEPHTPGQCDQCIAEGIQWVHLRMCTTCGVVGCCDSSPQQHATLHFKQTGHPVMRSAEPGEDWRWCYLHEITG